MAARLLELLGSNLLCLAVPQFPTTAEKFEIGALFLRLGLPATLICHQNGPFRKHRFSNQRNLKTPALRFSVEERKHSGTKLRSENDEFTMIVAFLNSSGVVWAENI